MVLLDLASLRDAVSAALADAIQLEGMLMVGFDVGRKMDVVVEMVKKSLDPEEQCWSRCHPPVAEGWTLWGFTAFGAAQTPSSALWTAPRVRVQPLVKRSRLCVSKQPTSFPETCKLQTVSSLPLANTNLMYIFGPRHLAS